MTMRSTFWLTSSSTCERCTRESFWASLKITSSPGWAAAALRTSAFICWRQGSPEVALAHADDAVLLGVGGGREQDEARREQGRSAAASFIVTSSGPMRRRRAAHDMSVQRPRRERWKSTAPTMIAPVSMRRPASPTAFRLRIFCR